MCILFFIFELQLWLLSKEKHKPRSLYHTGLADLSSLCWVFHHYAAEKKKSNVVHRHTTKWRKNEKCCSGSFSWPRSSARSFNPAQRVSLPNRILTELQPIPAHDKLISQSQKGKRRSLYWHRSAVGLWRTVGVLSFTDGATFQTTLENMCVDYSTVSLSGPWYLKFLQNCLVCVPVSVPVCACVCVCLRTMYALAQVYTFPHADILQRFCLFFPNATVDLDLKCQNLKKPNV